MSLTGTSGIALGKLGRALVVDLSEERGALGAHCQVGQPHATIFYRQSGFHGDAELEQLAAFREEWLEKRGVQRVSYDLSKKWGGKSQELGGELANFVLDARRFFMDKFGCDPKDQRLPHVELR